MTVTEITPRGKTRCRVSTDADFAFCMSSRELRKLGLSVGTVISEEMLREVLLPLLEKAALRRVADLLKDRDYTEQELRRKLRENGNPEVCIDAVLQWAEEHHYVDDRRYAENYVSWHGAGKSRRRILSELLLKGIDKELAESLLNEMPPDEETQILEQLKKKHYDPENCDPAEKRRIAAYLGRRGYTWSEIESAMRVFAERGAGQEDRENPDS